MGNVKIKASKVAEAKAQAKIVEDSLRETQKKCSDLTSYVASAKWDGKTRDSFLTYIELIEKYHKEVKSRYKKQRKALQKLSEFEADFEESSQVREVKRL
ncbi:WXG100 family type VII secretion target [Listeria aquatica]|uniref:WXG100 family type VII secretion target n=1 Tax=Listeria aquatica TaxID=1494960 RepID=A0A841ZLY4_9LIST|nr:WXG100 family type VII secretion target [Listeria aquatica]MBC1521689.1 hypothetical protein [Listeria aquatica]